MAVLQAALRSAWAGLQSVLVQSGEVHLGGLLMYRGPLMFIIISGPVFTTLYVVGWLQSASGLPA